MTATEAHALTRDLPACTTRISRTVAPGGTSRARYDFSSYRRMAIIPAPWLDSLERYFNEGIETGGFLRAILENDLRGAVKRAELDRPIAVIYAVIGLLEEGAPDWGWGSAQNVAEWLDSWVELNEIEEDEFGA